MADFLEFIHTPSALAQPYAEDLVTSGELDDFTVSRREEQAHVELDRLAEQMGFFDSTYFVDSGRSVLIPAAFEADEPLRVTHFQGLSFSGEFKTHSTVRLGSIVGRSAIRALCLTFKNVTLLPFFDRVPDELLLHVPALAVSDMRRIGKGTE